MTVHIVTGANSGLGLSIIYRLSENAVKSKQEKDTKIVMACRNPKKAEEARESVLRKFPAAQIEILQVDLSDMTSVIKASEEIKRRYNHVDSLFCNAGICKVIGRNWNYLLVDLFKVGIVDFLVTSGRFLKQPQGELTKDGLGEIFASNVFGHYILIKKIEDLLENGGRIIWSGSHSAKREFFTMSDIQHLKGPMPYQSSKFLLDLVSLGLNDLYQSKGKKIYSLNTAPGLVISDLAYVIIPAFLWVFVIPLMTVLRFFVPTLCLDSYNGSEANIWCSVHPNPQQLDTSVQYVSLCKLKGSNLLTGEGGERYVEPRKLDATSAEAKEALRLLDDIREKKVEKAQ